MGSHMVVKSVRGRRRYVSYSVPPETVRDDIVAALEGADPPLKGSKAITCRNGKAVVRCAPGDVSALTSILSEALGGAESLDMSGTLRALRTRDPELAVPGRRKR